MKGMENPIDLHRRSNLSNIEICVILVSLIYTVGGGGGGGGSTFKQMKC